MTQKRVQFVQYLIAQGFQATGNRVVNQFARYNAIDQTAAVLWIDEDGQFKIYDENGIQFGHGTELYEIEALI